MDDIDLTSPAFSPGGRIPDKYTCSGVNISPELRWSSPPNGAKSLTLIFDDPDAPSGLFTHWVLYNLPADLDGLPENYRPSGDVRVGRSSTGEARYSGPCPPRGSTHHYYFRLYALDQALDLGTGASRQQVITAMDGHILAETELIGLFGR
jgi:Raf kinase inhibitor-like YbhB/YbcL family protein